MAVKFMGGSRVWKSGGGCTRVVGIWSRGSAGYSPPEAETISYILAKNFDVELFYAQISVSKWTTLIKSCRGKVTATSSSASY